MASFADGIGEAMAGVFKLAGCAFVFGVVGFGVAIWAVFFR